MSDFENEMFLSFDELCELTHYSQPSAQRRALVKMDIVFIKRPDNTNAVLRAHVHTILNSIKEEKEFTKPKMPKWGNM